jgi:hypothetical protein
VIRNTSARAVVEAADPSVLRSGRVISSTTSIPAWRAARSEAAAGMRTSGGCGSAIRAHPMRGRARRAAAAALVRME